MTEGNHSPSPALQAAAHAQWIREAKERQDQQDLLRPGDRLADAKVAGQCTFEHIAELVETYNLTSDENEQSKEDAQQAIYEHPLTVEVRSDWYTPGDAADREPSEYRILCSTGGPAVQIVGLLDQHGYPHTAQMQVQDWFTPWTDVEPEGDGKTQTRDVLLEYAQHFYFGG